MPDKSDDIKKDQRVRIVVEWLLDDWSAKDIIAQVVSKWGVSDRQAKRYIADARKQYITNKQEAIDIKRRQKVEQLKRDKRKIRQEYIGTPAGMKALLEIDKEINKLEALYPAVKLEISGKDGTPIQTETTHKVVFENYE